MRDGILHVIDVTFANNAAASPGPDVGGGAIYAIGSLGVIVVGSRFIGNSGSNGGAIGSLNSDLTLVDNSFDGNKATGSGANSIDSKCSVNGGESGNGGNGGAVAIDGGADGTVAICGNVFTHQRRRRARRRDVPHARQRAPADHDRPLRSSTATPPTAAARSTSTTATS